MRREGQFQQQWREGPMASNRLVRGWVTRAGSSLWFQTCKVSTPSPAECRTRTRTSSSPTRRKRRQGGAPPSTPSSSTSMTMTSTAPSPVATPTSLAPQSVWDSWLTALVAASSGSGKQVRFFSFFLSFSLLILFFLLLIIVVSFGKGSSFGYLGMFFGGMCTVFRVINMQGECLLWHCQCWGGFLYLKACGKNTLPCAVWFALISHCKLWYQFIRYVNKTFLLWDFWLIKWFSWVVALTLNFLSVSSVIVLYTVEMFLVHTQPS